MHEIERKFLVTKPLKTILSQHKGAIKGKKRIEQRYLAGKTGDWTIRIRKVSVAASTLAEHFLTMKKKITMTRCVEVETHIDPAFYDTMVLQCGIPLFKTRYCVEIEGHLWEIDVFDDFDGLVVAEIELRCEGEAFVRPDWLGLEVTEDKQYKNRQMVKALEKRAATA